MARPRTAPEELAPIERATSLSEALPHLRRPFAPNVVRAKPLSKAGKDGKGSAAFYMDSRLVVERLNAVVGPEHWHDEFRLLAPAEHATGVGIPVECRLTVLGVTKADVGEVAPGKPDGKAFKSAYSDALKRAAVKFGVGAYLYALPRKRAEIDVDPQGKERGFTASGRTYLANEYARWLDSAGNVFGQALDHGDATFSDDDPEPEGEPTRRENAGVNDPPRSWAELDAAFRAYDDAHPWGDWLNELGLAKWGKPIRELPPAERHVAFQKCTGAYLRLLDTRAPSDFPPPSRKEVQQAFAAVLDGIILDGPKVQMGGDETGKHPAPALSVEASEAAASDRDVDREAEADAMSAAMREGSGH